MTAVAAVPATLGRRLPGLDRLRGLAILLMVGDHVCVLLDAAGAPLLGYRYTLGRVAMPVFFVLAGFLARRLTWRHAQIFAVGLLLPLFVPWVDSPNVLCWWALGCVVLWLLRRYDVSPWVVIFTALAFAANGYPSMVGTGFSPLMLFALMACGQLLERSAFAWCSRLPGFLEVLGRRPVLWYVGHLLALQGVAAAVGWLS